VAFSSVMTGQVHNTGPEDMVN